MKLAVAALVIGLGMPALATGGQATKDEAVAMVNKAVSFIKSEGIEKAYAEIDNRQGQFVDRDLYIVVYGMDGKVLAHGANAKLIGRDMIDAQDVDGVYYVKDRVAMAAKSANFWQDYKFVNPTTKKIQPKQMYCEKLEATIVCGGIYKQ
jgi:signal transduction histidine kinase